VSAVVTILPAALDIRDVEDIRVRLLGVLNGASVMSVDVSGITAVDTAGVQLLLALKSEAMHRGVPLEFIGRSTALDRVASTLGLAAVLVGSAGHVR
jgi:anti-anti-sigma regulatory factor